MIHELTEHRPITIIGIVQVGLVAGGWTLCAGHMKLTGYRNPAIPFVWNPNSIFLRQWGLLLLLIPICWVSAAVYFETTRRFTVPKMVYIPVGILITGVLFLFLWDAAIMIGYPPIIRSVR